MKTVLRFETCRWIVVVLGLVLIVGVSGCPGNDDDDDENYEMGTSHDTEGQRIID